MSVEFVNGYPCYNCTDVDLAKKGVDPAHPKDGPYGVDAKDAKVGEANGAPSRDPAVSFGGSLAALNQSQATDNSGQDDSGSPRQAGSLVDLTA